MHKIKVGIEIDETSVKAAVILQEKKHFRILGMANHNLDPDNYLNLLRIIKKEFKLGKHPIIVSAPYSKAIIKELWLEAALNSHQMEIFLKRNSYKLFGKQDSELAIDFEVLENARNQNCVRAVAISKVLLKCYLNWFKELHLNLDIVDIDVFGLSRLSITCAHYKSEFTHAWVWIKTSEIILLVFRNNQLIFSKREYFCILEMQPQNLVNKILLFYNRLFPHLQIEQVCAVTAVKLSTDFDIPLVQLNSEIWLNYCNDHEIFCCLGLALYGR